MAKKRIQTLLGWDQFQRTKGNFKTEEERIYFLSHLATHMKWIDDPSFTKLLTNVLWVEKKIQYFSLVDLIKDYTLSTDPDCLLIQKALKKCLHIPKQDISQSLHFQVTRNSFFLNHHLT